LDRSKEKQQLETLKVLSRIWFDMIPQWASNIWINRINHWLKWTLWLENDIDLVNGNLWTSSDWELNKISLLEIKNFAQVTNIMISWNKDYPITVSTLGSIWKPLFKNKDWEKILDSDLKWYIRRQLWTKPSEKVLLNINNYKNEDSPQEKNK